MTQKLFKYDIGDEVWFIYNNAIKKRSVEDVKYMQSLDCKEYAIRINQGSKMFLWLCEDKIYTTKSALIKALEEQVE